MTSENNKKYDEEYEMELEKARAEYKDLMERGDEAVGDEDELEELMNETMTEEEIRECKFKTALFGAFVEYNQGKKIDIEKFEELSDRVYAEFKNLELVNA